MAQAYVPTILISDDEPLVVSALARLARKVGLSFISDTTSEHVVELARTRRPEVIILDLNQPIDGRDLLKELKADPLTADIRVVVLSALDDQFLRHQCFELGADDFVVKPFDSVFMIKVARMCGLTPDLSHSHWDSPSVPAPQVRPLRLAPV